MGRDNYDTTGEYRVNLPDGRVQIVSYSAGPDGYVADVKYEGEAAYPEEPAYKPAPKPLTQHPLTNPPLPQFTNLPPNPFTTLPQFTTNPPLLTTMPLSTTQHLLTNPPTRPTLSNQLLKKHPQKRPLRLPQKRLLPLLKKPLHLLKQHPLLKKLPEDDFSKSIKVWHLERSTKLLQH